MNFGYESLERGLRGWSTWAVRGPRTRGYVPVCQVPVCPEDLSLVGHPFRVRTNLSQRCEGRVRPTYPSPSSGPSPAEVTSQTTRDRTRLFVPDHRVRTLLGPLETPLGLLQRKRRKRGTLEGRRLRRSQRAQPRRPTTGDTTLPISSSSLLPRGTKGTREGESRVDTEIRRSKENRYWGMRVGQ